MSDSISTVCGCGFALTPVVNNGKLSMYCRLCRVKPNPKDIDRRAAKLKRQAPQLVDEQQLKVLLKTFPEEHREKIEKAVRPLCKF